MGKKDKIDYLIADFNNIQELIRFTDQKVAVISALCGVEIAAYFSIAQNLTFATGPLTAFNIFVFICAAAFIVLIMLTIFWGLIRIICPRLAKNYTKGDMSTYYFDHIACQEKNCFLGQIETLTEEKMIKDLSEQIFEVSKILKTKNAHCTTFIKLAFASSIALVALFFAAKGL